MTRHQVWIATVLCGAMGIAIPSVSRGADKSAETKKAPAKPAPIIPAKQGKSETIHLFNGRDLEGWEGHMDLFSVKDGAIVAHNTKPIKVSTYLLTKRKFSDFRLVCQVRQVKSKMHSGVAVWGHVAPEKGDEYTYMGHLVMFPFGYGVFDLHRRGGALGIDNKPMIAAGGGKARDYEWHEMEILTQGNRLRVAIDGKPCVDWREPEPKYVEEAQIGLQLHSNPDEQEIHFKDLVLTTFPEDKLTTVKSK